VIISIAVYCTVQNLQQLLCSKKTDSHLRYHSLARREKVSKREKLKEPALIRAPWLSVWINRHAEVWEDVMRKTWK
jgi:hypothetical protein